MTDDLSLRDRKKRRTRAAIVEAATRLFEERGYDATTVAEIAAAADISPRTFFGYFPTKDDVLFSGAEDRIHLAAQAITDREPRDRPIDAVRRAVERVLGSDSFAHDIGESLGRFRLAAALSSPAVQAGAMRRLLMASDAMARALHETYDELDELEAAAIAGIACGAICAATLTCLRRGDDIEQTRAQVGRAVEIAVRGIGSPSPSMP